MRRVSSDMRRFQGLVWCVLKSSPIPDVKGRRRSVGWMFCQDFHPLPTVGAGKTPREKGGASVRRHEGGLLLVKPSRRWPDEPVATELAEPVGGCAMGLNNRMWAGDWGLPEAT